MISANEFEKKQNILVDKHPFVIVDVQYATPSARGASTLVKVRIKSLLTGLVQDKSFKTSDKFEEPNVDKIPVVFLYPEGDTFHFMDNASYEQLTLDKSQLGEQSFYLKEDQEYQAFKYNSKIVSLELPAAVELKVIETEPAIKGASASGRSTKKATLETGLNVQVPLYIETGTVVRVNTQNGTVTGRA